MQLHDRRLMAERDARVVDRGEKHPPIGSARWEAQFGRGWTLGIVTGMLGMAGGALLATRSTSSAGTLRGGALFVGSFAAVALYGFAYIIRYQIAFGWFSRKDGNPNAIWPDERPLLYWGVIGTCAAVALVATCAAAWVFINAETLTRPAR